MAPRARRGGVSELGRKAFHAPALPTELPAHSARLSEPSRLVLAGVRSRWGRQESNLHMLVGSMRGLPWRAEERVRELEFLRTLISCQVPLPFGHSPMVRSAGVEPARPFGHWLLGPARLPDFATIACWRKDRGSNPEGEVCAPLARLAAECSRQPSACPSLWRKRRDSNPQRCHPLHAFETCS